MSVRVEYVRVNESVVKARLSADADAPGSAKLGAKFGAAPLVLLDTSGSMAGSRIAHCLGALEELVKLGPVRLITYASAATDHSLCAALPPIRAGGGTDFCRAWEAVVQSGHVGPIIFLTDGEDCSGFASRRDEYLRRLPRATQIFCVGIESQSNTQALIDLAKASPIPGEYSFFSAAMNNYKAEAQLLARQTFAEPYEFRGQRHYVGREPVDVYFADAEGDYPSSPTAPIDYLAYQTDALVKRGDAAPLAEVQALRDAAQALFVAAGRLDRVERKLQRQRLMPVFGLITQFYELRHKNQRIGHEQLAKLAMSARDARSSRFAKLAVDRAERNVERLAAQDAQLAALAAALEPAALPAALRDQECELSRKTVAELLADGDCLGIGLSCSAREACIADATLLEVKQVGSSRLGCADFLEAREWAADQFGISFAQPSRVLDDSSRVNVNAVLPLYLDAAHWRFAQHWVDRMAADASCRDPTQGSRAHTFYTYLLAWRAARRQSAKAGDYYDGIAGELRRVLQRLPLAVPRPEAFCAQAEQRMPDAVRSLPLLALAYEALELQAPPELALLCAEEQLRRDAAPIAMDVLCPVPAALIEPYVRANLHSAPGVPGAQGAHWARLRGTLLQRGRADAVAALDRQQAAAAGEAPRERVVVPDAEQFCAPPSCHCLPAAPAISKERAALMALQAWRCGKATDCVAQYKPLWALPEAEIQALWRRACVDHLQLRRQSALTAALQAAQSSSVAQDLLALRGASLLEWAAVLHSNCYVGRNVAEYASAASRLEHVEMLCRGYCDVGALLGVPLCLIATLNDLGAPRPPSSAEARAAARAERSERFSSWTPSVPRFSGKGKYLSGGTALFRRWRDQYGVELLRALPGCAAELRMRHWAAAVERLQATGGFAALASGDFWPAALQALGLPRDATHCPRLEVVLEQSKR